MNEKGGIGYHVMDPDGYPIQLTSATNGL
jgi:hypothetical protein